MHNSKLISVGKDIYYQEDGLQSLLTILQLQGVSVVGGLDWNTRIKPILANLIT